jgi:DNA repair protein RecN (Recombination protein N)
LSPEEHVREIARMFAGNTISDASVTAARQLIKQVRD